MFARYIICKKWNECYFTIMTSTCWYTHKTTPLLLQFNSLSFISSLLMLKRSCRLTIRVCTENRYSLTFVCSIASMRKRKKLFFLCSTPPFFTTYYKNVCILDFHHYCIETKLYICSRSFARNTQLLVLRKISYFLFFANTQSLSHTHARLSYNTFCTFVTYISFLTLDKIQ